MRRRLLLVCCLATIATHAAGQAPRPVCFDPASATTYSDSFVTIIQGQVRGWHRFSVERSASGFVYREQFDLPGVMGRDLRIALQKDLTVRSVEATGSLVGQAIGAQLTFNGRRATGWAITDIQTKPKRVTVDTLLPDGAFDGAALMALLPLLRWEAGVSYSLTMFDSDEMSITRQTLHIVGVESVTVPAGTFEAYRADLSTTESPVRLWYTRAAPHRLIKIGGDTDAFVTVLVRHQ